MSDIVEGIYRILVSDYGYTPDDAIFIMRYTASDPAKPNKEWKVPNSDGFITVRYRGDGRFVLEDHREIPRKGVSISRRKGYNPESKGIPEKAPEASRKDHPMPPTARGRRAAAPAPAPEPEPEANGVVDFQRYLDKDLSPTMADYVTWFEDTVASLEDVPIDKLFTLGASLYGHFQRSDFNKTQREARRTERAASRPDPEPEPEPEPTRRGRGRPAAAAKPAAPARSSARSAPAAPEPAAAPARRGRRPAAKASAEAPY